MSESRSYTWSAIYSALYTLQVFLDLIVLQRDSRRHLLVLFLNYSVSFSATDFWSQTLAWSWNWLCSRLLCGKIESFTSQWVIWHVPGSGKLEIELKRKLAHSLKTGYEINIGRDWRIYTVCMVWICGSERPGNVACLRAGHVCSYFIGQNFCELNPGVYE